jgi:ABC-2 type transport system ATP-binding protein
MIEAIGLTKRYGSKVAVNDLAFTVKPGQVTGFLPRSADVVTV